MIPGAKPSAAVLSAILLLSACGVRGEVLTDDQAAGAQGVEAAKGVRVYKPDYPQYLSAEELLQAASVVVRARSVGPGRVMKLLPTSRQGGAGQAVDEGVIVTVTTFRVAAVIKGQLDRGALIEIKQLGGLFEGVNYVEEGAAPLRRDTVYDLFLQTYPDAPASLLNPVQGQYVVQADGRSASLPGNTVTVNAEELLAPTTS